MRAVVITGPGGPGVLELRSVPDPRPGSDDLLVRVRAAGLNRADILQRRGRYPAPPGVLPDVPGLEFAGEVIETGDRVRGFREGDRVMGILGGGGHADKVALHHRLCLRVPPSMSWPEAAAVPEAFLTAFDALFERGSLAAGECCLIQAAASGVGTAALRLARAAGARPVGLCRTAEKRRRLEEGGNGPILDPAAPDLAEAILRGAGRDEIDLVLDLVGPTAWPLYARVLRSRGRIVLIGLLGGPRADLDLGFVLRDRITVTGAVLRSRPLEEKITLTREFARRALPQFVAGRLTAWVDRTYDVSHVSEAHEAMERNENLGKIVLTFGEE